MDETPLRVRVQRARVRALSLSTLIVAERSPIEALDAVEAVTDGFNLKLARRAVIVVARLLLVAQDEAFLESGPSATALVVFIGDAPRLARASMEGIGGCRGMSVRGVM